MRRGRRWGSIDGESLDGDELEGSDLDDIVETEISVSTTKVGSTVLFISPFIMIKTAQNDPDLPLGTSRGVETSFSALTWHPEIEPPL